MGTWECVGCLHVILHHVEHNKDGWGLSATEGCQRDNVGHFLSLPALIYFVFPP